MTSLNIDSAQGRALAFWAAEFLGRPARLIPLAGDAGGRCYFRLESQALLAMYGPDRAENRAWLHIGRHLKGLGLPLPEIRAFQPERGFFLIEDLGDGHLAAALNSGPREAAYEAYRQTIRLMADLHKRGAKSFQSGWCHQEPVYNAAMVEEKEIGYFLDSFVAGYLQEPEAGPEIRAEAARFSRAVEAEAPASGLIHRDFQSRNVMLSGRGPAIIDWQGARMGPGAYDLASLLNDPYVSIPDDWRAELIALYLEAMGRRDAEKVSRELLFIGAARLMQNLGAYGKLCGEGKNFGQWMRPAAERLVKHFENPLLRGWPLLANCAARALENI